MMDSFMMSSFLGFISLMGAVISIWDRPHFLVISNKSLGLIQAYVQCIAIVVEFNPLDP